jgi:hypothetical protein
MPRGCSPLPRATLSPPMRRMRNVAIAIARLDHPLKVKGVVRATGHRRLVLSDTSRDRESRRGRDRDRSAPKGSRGRRGSRGRIPRRAATCRQRHRWPEQRQPGGVAGQAEVAALRLVRANQTALANGPVARCWRRAGRASGAGGSASLIAPRSSVAGGAWYCSG